MPTDPLVEPPLIDPYANTREYPSRPTWLRAVLVAGALVILIWFLAKRGDSGLDDTVTKVGRVEVTARLCERPERFPDLGFAPGREVKHKVAPAFNGYGEVWLVK